MDQDVVGSLGALRADRVLLREDAPDHLEHHSDERVRDFEVLAQVFHRVDPVDPLDHVDHLVQTGLRLLPELPRHQPAGRLHAEGQELVVLADVVRNGAPDRGQPRDHLDGFDPERQRQA